MNPPEREKPSVTRWLGTAAMVSAVAAAWEGLGFVVGFLVVTIPPRVYQQQLADQPAPTWVAILGCALFMYGVVVFGTMLHVAKRRGRPLWVASSAKPRAWIESRRTWGVICGITIAIPLVFVSVVSRDSALRPMPFGFAVLLLVISIWRGWDSASA